MPLYVYDDERTKERKKERKQKNSLNTATIYSEHVATNCSNLSGSLLILLNKSNKKKPSVNKTCSFTDHMYSDRYCNTGL